MKWVVGRLSCLQFSMFHFQNRRKAFHLPLNIHTVTKDCGDYIKWHRPHFSNPLRKIPLAATAAMVTQTRCHFRQNTSAPPRTGEEDEHECTWHKVHPYLQPNVKLTSWDCCVRGINPKPEYSKITFEWLKNKTSYHSHRDWLWFPNCPQHPHPIPFFISHFMFLYKNKSAWWWLYILRCCHLFSSKREESYRTSISIYASFGVFANVEEENGTCKHFVVVIIGC